MAQLDAFLKSESGRQLVADERAKVNDLCRDLTRLGARGPLYRRSVFGTVFSWFERVWSLRVPRVGKDRSLPALDEEVMRRAGPRTFAADYEAFDALSVRYGGLFRGSVIVNYFVGTIAVAVTVATVLPQPQFIASSRVAYLATDFAHYATVFELVCIVCILLIYGFGRTPHAEPAVAGSQSARHGWSWRLARRWRERWLEYRLLAERFRYIELMLVISSSSASETPFHPGDGANLWYDEYFVSRVGSTRAGTISAASYRSQALALMLEQVQHHDTNCVRRGAIAARLERLAVILFFLSLGLCAIALIAELATRRCPMCGSTVSFNDNFRSILLFCALLVPTLSAAIHGILATTEYTKLAESSSEAANHIASLVGAVDMFHPGDELATPDTLKPINDAITAFAGAAINEASGWRATLHDKNVPLA